MRHGTAAPVCVARAPAPVAMAKKNGSARVRLSLTAGQATALHARTATWVCLLCPTVEPKHAVWAAIARGPVRREKGGSSDTGGGGSAGNSRASPLQTLPRAGVLSPGGRGVRQPPTFLASHGVCQPAVLPVLDSARATRKQAQGTRARCATTRGWVPGLVLGEEQRRRVGRLASGSLLRLLPFACKAAASCVLIVAAALLTVAPTLVGTRGCVTLCTHSHRTATLLRRVRCEIRYRVSRSRAVHRRRQLEVRARCG